MNDLPKAFSTSPSSTTHFWPAIIGAYVLCNFLFLLNRGIYWDDWSIILATDEYLKILYVEHGLGPLALLHGLLRSLPGSVTIYRCLAFLLYLGGFVALILFVKRERLLEGWNLLYVSLLAVTLPMNIAKISLICLLYAISFFAFSVSLLLCSRYRQRRSILTRVIVVALFIVAFVTQSFLVFFLFVWAFLVLRSDGVGLKRRMLSTLRHYPELVLLPFAFKAITLVAFPKSGFMAEYNTVSLSSLAAIPVGYMGLLRLTFQPIVENAVTILATHPLIVVLCTAGLFLLIRRNRPTDWDADTKWLPYIGIGISLVVFGAFPYLAVAKIPATYPFFTSRHQLLLPIGTAVLLYFALLAIMRVFEARPGTRHFVLCSIVVLGAMSSIQRYSKLQEEWFLVLGIKSQLAEIDAIRDHTGFVFDETSLPIENRRMFKTKEYSGFLREAFGDETRFGISVQEVENYERLGKSGVRFFNFNDFKYVAPQMLVKLVPEPSVADGLGTVRLVRGMFLDLFGRRRQLEKEMRQLVRLEVTPISESGLRTSTGSSATDR